MGPSRSQCIANDDTHTVYLTSALNANMQSAARNAIPIHQAVDDIVIVEWTQSSGADVRLTQGNFGGTGWWAYGTCTSNATYDGTDPRRWCVPVIVTFNMTHSSNWDGTAGGRRAVACHEVYARFGDVEVSIEQIVGSVEAPLPDRTRVNMEVFLVESEALAELRSNIPEERAIYFLRNKGPADSVDFYRLTNDEQGLLREFNGRVRIAPHGGTHFLTRLDGERFDEVLARVATARGST